MRDRENENRRQESGVKGQGLEIDAKREIREKQKSEGEGAKGG